MDPYAALDASIDGVINSAAAAAVPSLKINTSYSTNYYPPSHFQPQILNITEGLNIANSSTIYTTSSNYIAVPVGIMAPPLGSLSVEASYNQQQQSDMINLSTGDSMINRNNILQDDHLKYNCLLNFQAIAGKIYALMPESEAVDYEVFIMISNVNILNLYF